MANTLVTPNLLKLLPVWMREDGAVTALAENANQITSDVYAQLQILTKWDKIDEMSEAELDVLASELDVKWYDTTATIDVKRSLLKNSDKVHSKLGTKYAVEQVIQDYFGDGDVEEWFEYDGKPGHFRVRSKNINDVADNYLQFLEILDVIKRKSAWLDSIVLRVDANHDTYTGMMCHQIRHSTYTFSEEASN